MQITDNGACHGVLPTAVICAAWAITVSMVIAHDERRYQAGIYRRRPGAHRAAR